MDNKAQAPGAPKPLGFGGGLTAPSPFVTSYLPSSTAVLCPLALIFPRPSSALLLGFVLLALSGSPFLLISVLPLPFRSVSQPLPHLPSPLPHFLFLFIFIFLPPVLSTPLARSQCDTMQRSRLGGGCPGNRPSTYAQAGPHLTCWTNQLVPRSPFASQANSRSPQRVRH